MINNIDFQPNWASSPGDTIQEILSEKEISIDCFLDKINLPLSLVSKLLDGEELITIEIALKLNQILGGSIEFWMTRDYQYRANRYLTSSEGSNWVNNFPLKDMENFGWIKSSSNKAREVRSCLEFFNVVSIQAWNSKYATILKESRFRKSKSIKSKPEAVAAWIRRGEIESNKILYKPWNSKTFKQSLPTIKELTQYKDPKIFIPKLQKQCAEHGVAVVMVQTPKACSISGATIQQKNNKKILILSFRYKTDDQFWFTFFHEAGHLILHGKEYIFESEDNLLSQEEQEANDFAEQILIPEKEKQYFNNLTNDAKKVMKFARKIGISPGIIVGQLQFYKKINYNQLNNLKRKYTWDHYLNHET